jgi:hypothetical protein
MSPTQRTLEFYRAHGLHVEVVERWIPATRRRKDLFGFIDLVAMSPTHTFGIQATSTSNMSSRVEKILESELARVWVASPTRRLCVIGWRKYAEREAGRLWRPTERIITPTDFGGGPV